MASHEDVHATGDGRGPHLGGHGDLEPGLRDDGEREGQSDGDEGDASEAQRTIPEEGRVVCPETTGLASRLASTRVQASPTTLRASRNTSGTTSDGVRSGPARTSNVWKLVSANSTSIVLSDVSALRAPPGESGRASGPPPPGADPGGRAGGGGGGGGGGGCSRTFPWEPFGYTVRIAKYNTPEVVRGLAALGAYRGRHRLGRLGRCLQRYAP